MRNSLKYATYYDEIVCCVFEEEDFITKRIIDYYQEYLLGTIKCNNYRVRALDKAVHAYLKNLKFNKFVKEYLNALEDSNDNLDYYDNLDVNLPKLLKKYEKSIVLIGSSSKWL